jgi:hypothetical protein
MACAQPAVPTSPMAPMTAIPIETQAPKSGAIAAYLPGAYFHDAWAITPDDPGLTALEQFLKVAAATPAWVNRLMSLRNRIVSALGLKNLGTLSELDPAKPASAYQPGDRIGIFSLFANTGDEALLGDKDKHLDVVLSVHKEINATSGQVLVTVTTVVHVHNWLGRLYMLPVTPMHRIIVPAVLRAASRPRPA